VAAVLALSLLVLFSIYKFFGAGAAFEKADFAILFAAFLVFIASVFLWNWAWALVGGFSVGQAQLASFASMSGNLTPFGIGGDFMRSFFARSSSKSFSQVLASSLATKVYKILVAAAALVMFYPFLSGLDDQIKLSLSFGTVLVSAGAAAFLLFARFKPRVAESFLSSFEFGRRINLFAAEMRRHFAVPSPCILALLFLSLACEFAAFHAVFLALGISLGLHTSIAVFFLVFFATKAPFHALGISELVGIFLLQSQHPSAAIAAALISWDLVRAWAPALFSVAFVALNEK